MNFKLILSMSTTIKSFSDKQKRNLSDKSNEGDERKKTREREISLNVSLSKDDPDIFEKGIESQCCAGTIYSCLQNLNKKVNKIFELFSHRKKF